MEPMNLEDSIENES